MTDVEDLRPRLMEALEDLGSSPEVVAEELNALGIKGRKSKSRDCPIARYVKGFTFFPKGARVNALHSYVVITNTTTFDVPCPDAVAEFMTAFDAGDYPWLEEEEDE